MGVTLDPTTLRLVEGARHPPYLYDVGAADARAALAEMQTAPVPSGTTHDTVDVPTRDGAPLRAHLLRPATAGDAAPVIVYAHGGGWSIGDYRSHARFAQEIAVRSGLAVLLVEYGLAPERRYPAAVHELADTVAWVRAGGLAGAVDADRIALLGDCAGATMMAAVVLAAVDPGAVAAPPVQALAMLYPFSVPLPTDVSALQFAAGYTLRLHDVDHLWREYVPHRGARDELAAAPLTAGAAHAASLPPTLVITAEADVTRDPAEAFAARMRAAGADVTCVRYLGTVHDFAVLDALRWTPAARAAVAQTAAFLADALTPRSTRPAAGPRA